MPGSDESLMKSGSAFLDKALQAPGPREGMSIACIKAWQSRARRRTSTVMFAFSGHTVTCATVSPGAEREE